MTNFVITLKWVLLVITLIRVSADDMHGIERQDTNGKQKKVVCYYTNWSVYRPGTAKFTPHNINPYLCTHLIYAFGGLDKENGLRPYDKYQDIEQGGFAKFTGLKTYNKNLKTMLAIGGWNEGSARFSNLVADVDRRSALVKNVVKFLRQNNFDGLDLDWEYPAFRDGSKPADKENYALLVEELRDEFEKEASKTEKPRLLLSMAVPAGVDYIDKGYDIPKLNKYLDFMNILSYDYHSAYEPNVNHHAPLYSLQEESEYNFDTQLTIDYTIKYYLKKGADPEKLVLGIPTYGRSYTLFNNESTDLGSPSDGPGEQGEATREKGYLAYYEICANIANNDEWKEVQPKKSVMGSYAYRGNQWVSYDDVDIVKLKAKYVNEKGLGGIMYWSIDNDDFRGKCHDKPYPLIETGKAALLSSSGNSANTITSSKEEKRIKLGNRKNRPKQQPTTAKPQSTTSKKTITSTTINALTTPEPPTTPDPGTDFVCKEDGFFPHPRDCKKYFWCLDSGPSNLGIVAHQFTCPSGLLFNKVTDSCDYSRNVICNKKSEKPPTTTTTTRSTTATSGSKSTTITTTEFPLKEEKYEEEEEDAESQEDPKAIKQLIILIKKLGGINELEKQLKIDDGSQEVTTPAISEKLYNKVFISPSSNRGHHRNAASGPQNEGLPPANDEDVPYRKDKPQYVTIQRSRPTKTVFPDAEDSGTMNNKSIQRIEVSDYVVDDEEEDPLSLKYTPSTRSKSSTEGRSTLSRYITLVRNKPSTAHTEVDESSHETSTRASRPTIIRTADVSAERPRDKVSENETTTAQTWSVTSAQYITARAQTSTNATDWFAESTTTASSKTFFVYTQSTPEEVQNTMISANTVEPPSQSFSTSIATTVISTVRESATEKTRIPLKMYREYTKKNRTIYRHEAATNLVRESKKLKNAPSVLSPKSSTRPSFFRSRKLSKTTESTILTNTPSSVTPHSRLFARQKSTSVDLSTDAEDLTTKQSRFEPSSTESNSNIDNFFKKRRLSSTTEREPDSPQPKLLPMHKISFAVDSSSSIRSRTNNKFIRSTMESQPELDDQIQDLTTEWIFTENSDSRHRDIATKKHYFGRRTQYPAVNTTVEGSNVAVDVIRRTSYNDHKGHRSQNGERNNTVAFPRRPRFRSENTEINTIVQGSATADRPLVRFQHIEASNTAQEWSTAEERSRQRNDNFIYKNSTEEPISPTVGINTTVVSATSRKYSYSEYFRHRGQVEGSTPSAIDINTTEASSHKSLYSDRFRHRTQVEGSTLPRININSTEGSIISVRPLHSDSFRYRGQYEGSTPAAVDISTSEVLSHKSLYSNRFRHRTRVEMSTLPFIDINSTKRSITSARPLYSVRFRHRGQSEGSTPPTVDINTFEALSHKSMYRDRFKHGPLVEWSTRPTIDISSTDGSITSARHLNRGQAMGLTPPAVDINTTESLFHKSLYSDRFRHRTQVEGSTLPLSDITTEGSSLPSVDLINTQGSATTHKLSRLKIHVQGLTTIPSPSPTTNIRKFTAHKSPLLDRFHFKLHHENSSPTTHKSSVSDHFHYWARTSNHTFNELTTPLVDAEEYFTSRSVASPMSEAYSRDKSRNNSRFLKNPESNYKEMYGRVRPSSYQTRANSFLYFLQKNDETPASEVVQKVDQNLAVSAQRGRKKFTRNEAKIKQDSRSRLSPTHSTTANPGIRNRGSIKAKNSLSRAEIKELVNSVNSSLWRPINKIEETYYDPVTSKSKFTRWHPPEFAFVSNISSFGNTKMYTLANDLNYRLYENMAEDYYVITDTPTRASPFEEATMQDVFRVSETKYVPESARHMYSAGERRKVADKPKSTVKTTTEEEIIRNRGNFRHRDHKVVPGRSKSTTTSITSNEDTSTESNKLRSRFKRRKGRPENRSINTPRNENFLPLAETETATVTRHKNYDISLRDSAIVSDYLPVPEPLLKSNETNYDQLIVNNLYLEDLETQINKLPNKNYNLDDVSDLANPAVVAIINIKTLPPASPQVTYPRTMTVAPPLTTYTREVVEQYFQPKLKYTTRMKTSPFIQGQSTPRTSNIRTTTQVQSLQDVYSDYEEEDAEYQAEPVKIPITGKVRIHSDGYIECLDMGNFPHPFSCHKFISCAKMDYDSLLGWEYTCPKGLSFDPIGGICNWAAGLGCKD